MKAELDYAEVAREVRDLVSRTRDRCLWFYARDYFPSDREAMIRVLALIERHGDRENYAQARRLREWLLQNSSAKYSR